MGMTYLEALILGVVQGVTEFLPISSSGHLVIGESLLGLEVEHLKSFDVLVHLATLLAIVIYFWSDFVELVRAFFRFVSGRGEGGKYEKLVGAIVVGTVPAVIVGFFAGDIIDEVFRDTEMVGLMMAVAAIFFLLAEKVYKNAAEKRDLNDMNWRRAIWIGVAQAFALIPGISRSGSTISAGLFGGMDRSEAARFSFLLGIPAMLGAGVLTATGDGGFNSVEAGVLIVGFLASFLAGLASVAFLMKFLKKYSLRVFALYLILMAVALFAF